MVGFIHYKSLSIYLVLAVTFHIGVIMTDLLLFPCSASFMAKLGLSGLGCGVTFMTIFLAQLFISHAWELASFYLAWMGARVFGPASCFGQAMNPG